MKTYTHPNIVMPCGNVVVKFYDFADSGNETLPKCIKEIGDVEEGFEINFGDYYSPECEFVLHNNSTNTIYDMLINNDLFVSVVIDNSDLYFYGFVDKNSIDTNNLKTEISFEGVHSFATLSNYKIEDFETDIVALSDGPDGYNRIRTYLRFISKYCKLASFVVDDIEFIVSRKYAWFDDPSWVEFYINDVLLNNNQWDTSPPITNRYEKIFTNAFEILNALKNDFFFYPSIVYDGTDFKLKIIEKDYYGNNSVDLPNIKSESEDLTFANKRLLVDAKDRPDTIAATDIRFEAEDATLYDSSEITINHIHTNVADAILHNVPLYVPESHSSPLSALSVARVSNYDGSSYVDYSSFHEAMFEAVKINHFNYKKGIVLKLHGLKASYYGTSKIEYLSPGYRFIKGGLDHYIHSVRRSIMKNESEAKCLVLG